MLLVCLAWLGRSLSNEGIGLSTAGGVLSVLIYGANLKRDLNLGVRYVTWAAQAIVAAIWIWYCELLTFSPVEGSLRGYHELGPWPILAMWGFAVVLGLAPAASWRARYHEAQQYRRAMDVGPPD